MNKVLDIIVPFFNEEDVIDAFISKLNIVKENIEKTKQIEIQMILINNGSNDSTLDKLKKFSNNSNKIKVINLIRNFGIDGALKAGIDNSDGDAAVLIHGDLQDDPKKIIELINFWEQGYEQVIVRYKQKNRENLFRKIGSSIYYKWANYASGNLIISGVSDYRLISKNIINFAKDLNESVYLLRGILIWPGYDYKVIDGVKEKRPAGTSKLNLPTILKYFKLPISISTRILFVIPIFSLIIFLISFVFIVGTLIYFVATGDLLFEIEPRLTLLIIMNVVVLLILGIISSYLGILIEEIKKRPTYIND